MSTDDKYIIKKAHKSWACMYRNDKGETGSMHGNIESVTQMAVRLGATSISLALENGDASNLSTVESNTATP